MGSSMSTLKIGTIVWDIRSHNGKVAYVFGDSHSIRFDPASNGYVMLECGKQIVWSGTAAECLEVGTRIVFDYVARSFAPSWEQVNHDCFDVGASLSAWFR